MTNAESRKRILDACQVAKEIVATWPAWKQNILRDLASSTCPAREPVVKTPDKETDAQKGGE